MSNFEDMFLESIPYKCDACSGRMIYKGGGSYECMDCGKTALDAFGKVKTFLDEYGTQPMLVVAEETGVPVEVLDKMLKDGRLQLPPGSKVYLRCEKCGCAIRSGRYCSHCELETFREIEHLMKEDRKKELLEKKESQEKKGTVIKRSGAKMRYADKDHL